MAGTQYFDPGTYPAFKAAGASSPMRATLAGVVSGFGKFPALSASNANKPMVLNAGNTAWTVTTGTLALAGDFSTVGAFSLAITVSANTTVTLPTTGTLLTTTGVAASATKLATARNINGVAFDGTANITVTAAAGTLTGTTLKSTVVTSSLTSVGALTNITPGADFTLTQNSVAAFTSVESGAIVNTLYVKAGQVGIGTIPGARLHVLGGSSGETPSSVEGLFVETGGSLNTFFVLQAASNGGGKSFSITNAGRVGIGTTVPGNPLAVNRSGDGIIVDFESADTVEGNVSIAVNTTSYNAFVGSHYTQLKPGQEEPPIGGVVVSTGEIIPCVTEDDIETSEIVDASVAFDEPVSVDKTVQDVNTNGSPKTLTIVTYEVDHENRAIVEVRKQEPAMITSSVVISPLKPGHALDGETGVITKTVVTPGTRIVPGKEYFPYIDGTVIDGDTRVYGTWHGKMSDDSFGMSFGDPVKPVYLVSQVGLWKCRVTDSNGDIKNGDFLQTSARKYEAERNLSQEQSTAVFASAKVDVLWTDEPVDLELGYKWKLIPVTFCK